MNQKEIAAHFGVSQGTVSKWKRDGMPRGSDGGYEPSVVASWRSKRYRAWGKKGSEEVVEEVVDVPTFDPGTVAAGLAVGVATSSPPDGVEGIPGWDDPRFRKEVELAYRYWLDRQERMGNLVEKDVAIRWNQKLVTEAKARLETLPEMVALLLTSEGLRQVWRGDRDGGDIREVVKDQIRETVADVMRGLQRG